MFKLVLIIVVIGTTSNSVVSVHTVDGIKAEKECEEALVKSREIGNEDSMARLLPGSKKVVVDGFCVRAG